MEPQSLNGSSFRGNRVQLKGKYPDRDYSPAGMRMRMDALEDGHASLKADTAEILTVVKTVKQWVKVGLPAVITALVTSGLIDGRAAKVIGAFLQGFNQ